MIYRLSLLAVAMVVWGCSSSATPNDAIPVEPGKASPTNTVAIVPAGKLTPQDLAEQADVPIYPGATFPDSQTQMPKKDEAGKMHTYLIMSTKDSLEKVGSFYQGHGQYQLMQTKDGTEVQGRSPKGHLVLIDLTTVAGATNISVKSVSP